MSKYIGKLSLSHAIPNMKMTQDFINTVDMLEVVQNPYRIPEFIEERKNLTRFEWVVTSPSTIDVIVESKTELSPEFIHYLNEEIDAQNTDGLGESLEQQDFAWSDEEYFDEFLQEELPLGGASTSWTDDNLKLQKA